MRLLFTLILSFQLFFSLFCQDQMNHNLDDDSQYFQNNNKFEEVEHMYLNGTKWVLDSFHHYYIYQDELYLKNRYIILTRNGVGDFTSAIYLVKQSPNDTWQNDYFVNKSYYDSGKKHESLEKYWDDDNNMWIDSTKYEFYNQDGKRIRSFYKNWSQTEDQFTWGNQSFYTYDSDNYTISRRDMKWEKEVVNWENFKLYFYDYNLEKKITKTLKLIWDTELNMWTNSTQELNEYDSDNNKLKIIDQIWDNNNWVNDEQIINTYNPENKKIRQLTQTWRDNTWINDDQIFFEYNSDGYEISRLNQIWDKIKNEWTKKSSSNKLFNSTKKLIESISQNWSIDNGEVSSGNKYIYAYNGNNNRTQTIYQIWDVDLKSWVNKVKNDYTYDNYLIKNVSQKWDDNDFWINYTQVLYEYDINGSPILTIYQNWNPDLSMWINDSKYTNNTFDNKTQKLKHLWDSEHNFWNLISQIDNFWSEFEILNNSEECFSNIKIYPNPVSNNLLLEGINITDIKNIEIYSINGELVLEKPKLYGNSIYIQNIKSGIYILKLLTLKGEILKKFIIEN